MSGLLLSTLVVVVLLVYTAAVGQCRVPWPALFQDELGQATRTDWVHLDANMDSHLSYYYPDPHRLAVGQWGTRGGPLKKVR